MHWTDRQDRYILDVRRPISKEAAQREALRQQPLKELTAICVVHRYILAIPLKPLLVAQLYSVQLGEF
jgi:hypothetical protein